MWTRAQTHPGRRGFTQTMRRTSTQLLRDRHPAKNRGNSAVDRAVARASSRILNKGTIRNSNTTRNNNISSRITPSSNTSSP